MYRLNEFYSVSCSSIHTIVVNRSHGLSVSTKSSVLVSITRFTVSLGTIGSIFCSRLQRSARQLTWSIIIAITMVIHKNVRTRQVESYPDSRLRIRPTLWVNEAGNQRRSNSRFSQFKRDPTVWIPGGHNALFLIWIGLFDQALVRMRCSRSWQPTRQRVQNNLIA